MSNSFYNHGAFPSTGSAATSASMRAELDLVAAGFDKMPTLAGNANKFIVVNSTGTGLTQTDVLPAFTVTDTDFTVQDNGDNTRKFQFNAGSITTGNTRVYVMPDLDTTLVGTNVTQTLTNKTLTAPVIATIVNTGTLTLPTSTDTLVGRNTTDTLTNKTLTNPVIGTIVNTGTLTLPTSTDTLVGRQTTDTLTNKTISGASNTLSNIANGSLSNSSIVIGSTTLSLGGTMTTLAGVTISGASNTLSNIANASLTNSSITINGSTVALGSSVTVTATATNALTIGNGLSGTSYNGSAAVTIAINTGVTADLSTAQTFSNKTISGSANTLSNIANASLTNSAITIGSTAISLGATSLTLAGLTSASATTLISTGNQATSVAISAIGHSSGTVTVTTGTAHGLTTGDVASIDGVADYTFCGVYTVTVTNANVFTYSQTASGASSSGGFSTKLNGTWGLYAGGTGPSLHNGPVIVSASSQMPALRVTQGGNGYALIVEDAANPDTSAFIISNAGDLTINTNKFTVAAASGNTVIAGTTSLNGNVTFATDATYDIGASGATRPRDLFLSRNLVVGGTLTLAGGVNLNGNVTIGDASTDTLTINSTITSNLIFTDNTYDIGASGATRPRTGYFGTSVITPLIDATNLEVTNIKALDGTAAITIANTTGAVAVSTNLTIGDASSDTLTINSTVTSNLIFTDNTYDIGASGATRPRNVYVGTAIVAGTTIAAGGAIKSTGANLVNEASAIKISQETTAISRVSAYGNDASTQGSLQIRTISSDGTASAVPALFSSTGLAVTGTLSATGNITAGNSGGNFDVVVGNASANWSSGVILKGSSTNTNWEIGQNRLASSALTFTPSTAGGGSTFTTSAMTLLSTGMGVGTNTPQFKLDVINNATYQLRLATGTGQNYVNGGLYLGAFGTSDPYYYGYMRWDQTDISLKIGSQHGNSTGGIIFLTGDGNGAQTERVRIKYDGSFLIGTTIARNRLTVQGTVFSTPTLGTASGQAFFGDAAGYGTMIGTSGFGYGWIQQQRVDGTATAYDLYLQPAGGFVTIGGTGNDGRRLTVLGNSNDSAGIGITYSGVAAASISVNSGGSLLFNLNNSNGKTERAQITPLGSFLVGTADADTAAATIVAERSGTTASTGAYFVVKNQNGAQATNGALTPAGGILFSTYRDVRNPSYTAGITYEARGVNGTNTGAELIFRTSNGAGGNFTNEGNAALPPEVGRFTSAGLLQINGDNGFTSALKLSVVSEAGGSNAAFMFKNSAGNAQWTGWVWNASTVNDALFIQFLTEAGGTGRGSITYNRGAGLLQFNNTSDYRAKDIYGPIVDSGTLIDSVPVYMGKMKGATQERPMFLAHETPAYAHTGEKDAVDKDGNPVYQQMDTSTLVPVMWAEIQSLRQRLAAAGI